jgi:isoleucyl-tRNA synthetase
VSYRLLPDNKLLGPRFGAQFPQVREALAALDPARATALLQAGQNLVVELDGGAVELAPNEVIVQSQAVSGLAVASEKGLTAAIDTAITPELRAEGLAREIVRRVQDMRKKAGFNIEDRITTYYQADGELAEVMEKWGGVISAETLTTRLENNHPPSGVYIEEVSVDGLRITLGVQRG